MKKYISLLIVLTLNGCSIFPGTKEELLKTGNPSQTYCISENRKTVEARIENYLAKCFRPSYVNAGNGTGFVNNLTISKSQESNKTEFSVSVPSGTGAGYFLNAVVSDGENDCKTKMSATAYNFMWERNFSKLFESANGGDPWCPI